MLAVSAVKDVSILPGKCFFFVTFATPSKSFHLLLKCSLLRGKVQILFCSTK